MVHIGFSVEYCFVLKTVWFHVYTWYDLVQNIVCLENIMNHVRYTSSI